MNLKQLPLSFDPAPLAAALAAKPELWDQITARQDYPGSVHHDTKCIFVRGPEEPTMESVLYGSAVDYPALDELHEELYPLVTLLVQSLGLEQPDLGRVMITTLKAGGAIDPHIDEGDYAIKYDRFHFVITSEPGNHFTVDGETVDMQPGSVWWFNHQREHRVVNESNKDRWHLIVDIVAPQYRALRGVVFQRERVSTVWDQIQPLLQAHYDEIAHFKDFPLKPDRAFYQSMCELDKLHVYTMRDCGVLVGYNVAFIGENKHYTDMNQATEDILWTDPKVRGTTAGYRFIKWVDDRLAAFGADTSYRHQKAAHPAYGRVLEKQGYEIVDIIWAKRLTKPGKEK